MRRIAARTKLVVTLKGKIGSYEDGLEMYDGRWEV